MAINFFNDVAVDTNVLYVDTSSNRVGIGTTTPGVRLDIDSGDGIKVRDSGDVIFEANPTNGSFSLGDTGGVGGTAYITSNNTDIDFFGDGDVRFQNNGNVGIGTASPSQKLTVNGNVTANRYYGTGSTTYYVDPNDTSQAAYFAGDIRITDSGTATIKLDSTSIFPGATIFATKNGSTSPPMGDISWVENPGFQGSTWSQRLSNSPYTESSIKLPTSSSYNFAIKTLGSDRMVINSSGNVGIGTTSPSTKLDVNGQISATSEINAGGDGYQIGGFGIALFNSNVLTLGDWDGQDFPTRIMDNNSAEVMRITGGKVGIGTPSPSSKLQVDGAVQVANDTDTASASKVGALRYRTSGNNSYVDMCMQTGASTYAWVNIVQNSW